MRSKLSSLVIQIKPSGIRRFFDLAETMDGVISLGVGNQTLKHHGQFVMLLLSPSSEVIHRILKEKDFLI